MTKHNRTFGFTFIEILVVLTMMGVMAAMTVPMFRVSPVQKVDSAAIQLVRDLELARTRAMATRSQVRMVFDPVAQRYIGYLDHDRDSVIDQTTVESKALRGMGMRDLPGDVLFGVGSGGTVPGELGSPPITFATNKLEFGPNGVTDPFGTRGTFYLVHRDDPSATAAVTVTGSGSFKAWQYRAGWQ